ncbi:hypothetical protein ABT126_29505 [Streptomyces sp. NPDC002012]|uniref:hypothetical protein n=1 Tax=Streptomyces sp. NPDC002012 TaxID=3154532 RepID=UPI00332AD171
MTSDDRPTVQPAVDPMDDLVLAVRGDGDGSASDYELPPAVTLDQASDVLGLDRTEGLRMAEAGTYPVKVIPVGSEGYRVGTAPLIRAAGLSAVRETLRVEG